VPLPHYNDHMRGGLVSAVAVSVLVAGLGGCAQEVGGGWSISFCGKAPLLTGEDIVFGYHLDLAAHPYGERVTWHAVPGEATVELTSSCAQGATYSFTDPRLVHVTAATTARDGLPVAIAAQPAAPGITTLTVYRDGKQVAELRITVIGTLYQPSPAPTWPEGATPQRRGIT
jgi:hypothetical protein